ncbi:hypothetical protein C8A05DRAFT_17221 [Staphylotrichum tortipilum]|uniref:Ankyrin n=1 Tax=Staphylotrichum tortipilum TaxID=2831512 RepID=A0AAN6MHU2_9PEZI|nr:hypothetical protein C8A05DRAFT_17221 [Staphylotrichum longicolle]
MSAATTLTTPVAPNKGHCHEASPRISYTPRSHARPKRLSRTECREIFSSTDSLPSIQIHGSGCRCSETLNDNELQDDLLADKISSLTKTILLTTDSCLQPRNTTKPPPPRTRHHHDTPPNPHRRSGTKNHILSSLTRLFSPPSNTLTPTPTLQHQSDLCIGAAALDIDKVARYLVLPAGPHHPSLPVNAPNHLGVTPLLAAVQSPAGAALPKAQLAMVKFLVEVCGADPEAGVRVDRVTGDGESLLTAACTAGLVGVVRYLVGRGVRVDRRLPCGAGMGSRKGKGVGCGGQGRTALHVAVLAGRAECVEVLVQEGRADVDAVCEGVVQGARDVAGGEPGAGLKGLRRRSASREKRVRNPVSALHLARGSPACTRVLLQAGAKVSVKDGFGRTSLHWAAEAGSFDVVQLLVSAGADVNAVAEDGSTPLALILASIGNGQGEEREVEVAKMVLKGATSSGREGQDEKSGMTLTEE